MGKVKAKRRNLSESATMKANVPKKKLNPFEMHVNRVKFDIVGRKTKSDRGLPGISRSKAIIKRKSTLLQEYKVKDKSNRFFDRRIGENNRAMTHEDRLVARFATARMKMFNKKQIFNLADDEVLTHRGQTLSEIEKFDDPCSDDDDMEDPGKLSANFVEDAHFGGGMLRKSEEGDKKSRQDLINQLITESKKRKAEKQRVREQTVELTEKLDTEWRDLLPIVALSKKKPTDHVEIEKPDSYDTMMRELKFEARGYASEPLKTEEQAQEEEQKRRAELEAERKRRMLLDVQEEEGINQPPKHRSADDLDDGFAIDDEPEAPFISYDFEGNLRLNGQTREKADGMQETFSESIIAQNSKENDNDKDSDDDDDNEDDDGSGDDYDDDEGEEDSGSDISLSDLKPTSQNEDFDHTDTQELASEEDANEEGVGDEQGEDDDEEEKKDNSDEERKEDGGVTVEQQQRQEVEYNKMLSNNTQNIGIAAQYPVVLAENEKKMLLLEVEKKFPDFSIVPKNYKKLRKVLKLYSAEKQAVIITQIMEKNHISLSEDNRARLETLFGFLLEHLHNSSSQGAVECFRVLNSLAPALYDLTHMSPESTSYNVLEMLKEKQQEFQKHQHKYPSLNTLLLLKVIGLLFSTSDFRHPVVTPSIVFMCQMLFQCRIRTKRDVSAGLFLVTLFLEFTVLSKRFSPAAVNFLCGVLHLAIPKRLEDVQNVSSIPPFRRVGPYSDLLVLENKVEQTEEPLRMRLSDLSDEEPIDTAFKIRAFATALSMLHEFLLNLGDLAASSGIFHCATVLLSKVPTENYPSRIQSEIEKLSGAFQQLKEKKLQYVVIDRKRPKALRLYEPIIEKIVDLKQRRPMSKEKMEREKLVHKVKRERKAAIREIRRDNSFLAKLKWKETAQSDAERKQKVKEIFGSASAQLGEIRALERKKKRMKK